tara:strand:- start:390 stop:533 length:144 start_codon:yes stop_codon:yes gene_type:complete
MNIELMKRIILNLSEWMNTPNEELENMMGVSWMQFWDLVNSLEGEEE